MAEMSRWKMRYESVRRGVKVDLNRIPWIRAESPWWFLGILGILGILGTPRVRVWRSRFG